MRWKNRATEGKAGPRSRETRLKGIEEGARTIVDRVYNGNAAIQEDVTVPPLEIQWLNYYSWFSVG